MMRGGSALDARSRGPVTAVVGRSSASIGVLDAAVHGVSFHGLIGRTPAMQQLFASIARFAPHARTTLITGETGTGKAAVARALYRLGPRRGGAFVTVECADAVATPWTDAIGRDADTTLFFDDVADLTAPAQTRLAQYLASADEDAAPDTAVHVIAATSQDLRAAIGQGRFRPELYYRLGVFALQLPPLRERLADVPELATAFLREITARLRLRIHGLSPAAQRLLQAQPWLGNLRELRNTVERACVLTDGDLVGEGAVRAALLDAAPTDIAGAAAIHAAVDAPSRLDDAQRAHVRAVLRAAHGNKTRAAADLGISRRALYRLIDRLGA